MAAMPPRRSPSRRAFLRSAGLAIPIAFTGVSLAAVPRARRLVPAHAAQEKSPPQETPADLVIAGGGFGGCAAALAAARNGLRVVMTEETDWIGGQLTAQAVPLDENAWIESVGGSRSYQELRHRVRDYYARNFPLSSEARANPRLNPGNGSVSRLCHEPRAGLAALEEMLAPHVASGRLRLLAGHHIVDADVAGDRVRSVRVRSLASRRDLVLHAPYCIDATELGDLLALTGTEYVTGAESQRETGEPHAKPEAEPHNHQAFTCCFATDYLAGEDHVIDRPREYGFWRDHVPALTPPWPGRLLSLVYSQPRTLEPFDMGFDPSQGTGLFRYRRIIDRTNFAPGTYDGDLTLVNWPQNDYMLGNIIGVAPQEASRHVARAKQLSLSLLYWLQTECPREDGGTGWKGLRLRPDVVGTEDGLAKYPYVRESRRIRAEFTVLEQHVSSAVRMQVDRVKDQAEARAERFADSVGIGSYPIDLHPSTGGDNYIDFPARPFQIPLGALLPVRMENLLPACKNIGTTHITNGCYRLHPVEWNIGEAAGELVAFCLSEKAPPRAVRQRGPLLSAFQSRLVDCGVPLEWPD
jgi:hypothetical protein